MLGGVVSRATVTVNVQFVRLAQSSVAVQVTVVVPSEKNVPDAGEQVTATFVSALSEAVGGGHDTAAVVADAPQSQTIRLVGHWMTGGVVSRATVTVKVQTADSRQELVARQVTVVVPRMKLAPDGGEQVTTALVGQLPVVVGAGKVTTAVLATPQVQLVWLGGQLMRSGMDCWPKASGITPARIATRRKKLHLIPCRIGLVRARNGSALEKEAPAANKTGCGFFMGKTRYRFSLCVRLRVLAHVSEQRVKGT